jgi:hypothetical protein
LDKPAAIQIRPAILTMEHFRSWPILLQKSFEFFDEQ